MKKGCILFLLLFIGASGLEYYLIDTYRKDLSPFLGILLGLIVVATIANLWGIYHAFKQKRLLAKPQANWRDGDLVGVSGRLSAARDPLTAPASGRRVAIYEYDVKRITVTGSGKNRSTSTLTDYSGFGMAPCTVQTKRGAVKLVGFPMLAHFPTKQCTDRTEIDRLVDYISQAKLTPKAKGIGGALKQINEVLKDEDGEVLLDVRDDSAVTAPGEDFRNEFMGASYTIEENVIENGAQVTAFGTYHTNPQRLDVGGILDTFSHSVFPGEGDAVTSKNLMKSLIASVIFGAIAGVVHYFLYPQLMGH